MNDKAEKIYAGAFFELCTEKAGDELGDILGELETMNAAVEDNPDFIKLLGAPTITKEEKIALVKEIIAKGGFRELTGNLLCVLTESGRMDCFGGILKNFRALYNEHFGIAEIAVTSSTALPDETVEKIRAKMAEVTGKKISVKLKVDSALIGGAVIDYGSTRWDGSVRTRLAGLRKELGSVIA